MWTTAIFDTTKESCNSNPVVYYSAFIPEYNAVERTLKIHNDTRENAIKETNAKTDTTIIILASTDRVTMIRRKE